MNPIEQIDRILEAKDASFQDLLALAKLDPSQDLRGCDFRGVDFGELQTPILDLTRCDLRGANLSRVTAAVITTGADIDVQTRLPDFDRDGMLVAGQKVALRQMIERFHIATEVPENIVSRVFDERLIAAGYDSILEQDIATRNTESLLCEIITDRIEIGTRRSGPTRLIVYRTQQISFAQRQLSGIDCDKIFANLLEGDVIVGTHNFSQDGLTDRGEELLNRPARAHFRGQRSSLRQDLADDIISSVEQVTKADGYIICMFSGFPPFSRETWARLREYPRPIRFVILSPSQLLRQFLPERLAPRRRPTIDGIAPFSFIFPRNILDAHDIDNFIKRLRKYEGGGVVMHPSLIEAIDDCRGKSVSFLRELVINRIFGSDSDSER
ncbi:pentapeptide repeat-containing protein [Methylopila sp. 73B]|uniref:pentapeptide repeat-containing protein n=1 Tax=Methylopila sp. 73B TaxID=1120792 RepID=UPI0012DC2C98|nr:pentapeptide repeat-containing protein [Methylopila sp. 73B]